MQIVIEAFRLGIDYIPDWFMDKVTDRSITLLSDREVTDPFDHDHETMCDIKTLEGTMRGNHGDYIIKGVNGEIYPCKPDICSWCGERMCGKTNYCPNCGANMKGEENDG